MWGGRVGAVQGRPWRQARTQARRRPPEARAAAPNFPAALPPLPPPHPTPPHALPPLPPAAQGVQVSQAEVLDAAWVERHGGLDLEGALAEHLAGVFDPEGAHDPPITSQPRAMAKLRKQVRSTWRAWGGGARVAASPGLWPSSASR